MDITIQKLNGVPLHITAPGRSTRRRPAARSTAAGARRNSSSFPHDPRKQLDATLSSVADKWAADLETRGKPGCEVLDAFRAALGSGS